MENTSPDTPVRRLWNEVWSGGNAEVVDEIFTEPFVRHSSLGRDTSTRAAFKARLRESQRTLARPDTTIDDMAVAGDRVWTRATTRGVNLETGEMAVVTWMAVMRVESGRIAEQWVSIQRDVDWER